jgi:sensor histidine kinase regulating citrate/malate metabolism
LLVLVFSVFETTQLPGFEAGTYQRILYRLIDGLCCYYVLWVQLNRNENLRLQRELNGINTVWREQKKQYQVTRETIEGINRKCHDLKHQIRMIQKITDEQEKAEFLSEVERDIMIYDTALDTGNKALDTVLMEKGLRCQTNGIQWSCMADGSRLDFMRLDDIYAMFGNALDNAIRAVLKLEEQDKRVISVKIISQGDIMVIQIQNYYDGELKFEDGLPITTKKNKRDHGYGMKSIRYIAEKYKGTITAQAKNQIFTLQILIPVGGAD